MNKTPFALAAVFALLHPGVCRAQADREIVKVNGISIRQGEVLERLWKRHGPAMLEEMVDELLLRQKAKDLKVTADDAEVEKRLASIRAQFADPAVFEAQMKQSGATLESLSQDLREQLTQEKLLTKQLGITIKDEELKKAFETNKAKLGVPPAIHLRHMMVKTEAEAKDLGDKVRGGADFKTLAREKSLAPTGKLSGGDYGFVTRGMLPGELEDVAFAMKAGEVKVVPGRKGVHVLQVVEKRAAIPADLAKVKDDLRQMLLAEKIKKALPDYLQDLRAKADIEPQGSALGR